MKSTLTQAEQVKLDKRFLAEVENGNLEGVKELLKDRYHRPNLNFSKTFSMPYYCLTLALFNDRIEVFKYLLEETELKELTEEGGLRNFKDSEANPHKMVDELYGFAGKSGDLEFIKYLLRSLSIDSKYQVFVNAADNNHAHVLEYLVEDNVLSDKDKESIESVGDHLLKIAYISNSKKSVKFLTEFCENNSQRLLIRSGQFKAQALNGIIGNKEFNSSTKDFELFYSLINDIATQNDWAAVIGEKIFATIAKKGLLNLFINTIDTIESQDFKSQVLTQIIQGSKVEPDGLIKNYETLQYAIENYSQYFDSKAISALLYKTISSANEERRKERWVYKDLFERADPEELINLALKSKGKPLFIYTTEDASLIHTMEDIFNYKFIKEINLHENNNHYFKNIATGLSVHFPEKAIALLELTISKFPNINIEQIIPLFKGEETIDFLSKCLTRQRITQSLPEKLINTPRIKI